MNEPNAEPRFETTVGPVNHAPSVVITENMRPLEIATFKPDYSLRFINSAQKEIAVIRWENGALSLTGDADEAARMFAVAFGNHLSQKLQDYETALVSLDREPGVAAVLAKWRSTT